MLLFRSLTVGLLATCVWLLIGLVVGSRSAPVTAPPSASAAISRPRVSATSASILDVAPGVRDLASLVRLAPGEHVIAVDGQPVESDLAAGAALAAIPTDRGRYVDLVVAGTHELRRVVVLLH